jgi:hypothetical protein
MQQRIFHGKITPNDLASALMGEFNRGNLRAQQYGGGQRMVVQIRSHEMARSGGATALAVTLQSVEDGVAVEVGKQSWLGIAASLGQTALWFLLNRWSLLDRLDDVAQDVENLQVVGRVWEVIEATARSRGASFELSERLRRVMCEYCHAANPVGEPACVACGAPLGRSQPDTCPNCGFVLRKGERVCPNCKSRV